MLLYSFLGSLLDRNTLNDTAHLLLTFHLDYITSFHVCYFTASTHTDTNMLWPEQHAPGLKRLTI